MIVFIVSMKIFQKVVTDFVSNYQEVDSNDYLEGTIKEIRTYKGAAFITLMNGNKYYLPTSKNYALRPAVLGDFITEGDSLRKNENSSQLFIYRGSNQYEFRLGETISE